jgi:hypothetical protein
MAVLRWLIATVLGLIAIPPLFEAFPFSLMMLRIKAICDRLYILKSLAVTDVGHESAKDFYGCLSENLLAPHV